MADDLNDDWWQGAAKEPEAKQEDVQLDPEISAPNTGGKRGSASNDGQPQSKRASRKKQRNKKAVRRPRRVISRVLTTTSIE
jgi:hypothetical protein